MNMITLNYNPLTHAPVIGLLFTSSPFTIFKAIITIVIYPINSSVRLTEPLNMLKIRLVHIITKVSKIIYPTLTHPNSSSSIIFPPLIRRICCTLKHICPNMVKRFNLAFSKTMSSIIASLSRFMFKTTTAFGTSAFNMSFCNSFYGSAIANKLPIIISFFAYKFNRSKSTKSLSCNIFHKFIPETAGRFVSILPFPATKLIIPTS